MSANENSVNGNGKLFASRHDLYTDKNVQTKGNKRCEWDKTDCALVPRHRIAGKQRMPPYIEAPTIKVPEARRQRSHRIARSISKDRKKDGSQVTHQPETLEGQSDRGDVCVSGMIQMRVSEPLLVNDAVVMFVPKTYLSSAPSTTSTSGHKTPSKNTDRENHPVSFDVETYQCNQRNENILGKKVPPLYIPRPCHKMNELDSNEATLETSESEDENETPWGKRVAAIKVSRIKRDFDDETVSIDAPEGTLPVCARCGVAVYLAEEKRAAGRRFHISCFKCFLCSSSLDSANLFERNQEIYCKSCYVRQFGPKGYDYGPGEGALKME